MLMGSNHLKRIKVFAYLKQMTINIIIQSRSFCFKLTAKFNGWNISKDVVAYCNQRQIKGRSEFFVTIVNGCQPLSIVIRQYSSEDTFTEWKDGFVGEIFFKNGLTSSWGVTIGYLGNSTFKENKISKDNDGRILIIDVEVGDDAFFLINLFYSKPEVK